MTKFSLEGFVQPVNSGKGRPRIGSPEMRTTLAAILYTYKNELIVLTTYMKKVLARDKFITVADAPKGSPKRQIITLTKAGAAIAATAMRNPESKEIAYALAWFGGVPPSPAIVESAKESGWDGKPSFDASKLGKSSSKEQVAA